MKCGNELGISHGNGQPTRFRTLVIERLDVIDIAAMRRHPTTGKGAVLVACNDLPLGISRGPIGGRIDLHEEPTHCQDR